MSHPGKWPLPALSWPQHHRSPSLQAGNTGGRHKEEQQRGGKGRDNAQHLCPSVWAGEGGLEGNAGRDGMGRGREKCTSEVCKSPP